MKYRRQLDVVVQQKKKAIRAAATAGETIRPLQSLLIPENHISAIFYMSCQRTCTDKDLLRLNQQITGFDEVSGLSRRARGAPSDGMWGSVIFIRYIFSGRPNSIKTLAVLAAMCGTALEGLFPHSQRRDNENLKQFTRSVKAFNMT
jgi:hypothetical protein